MSSMAVSHSNDGHSPVTHQQNAGNRQVSLYASRLKSPTPPPSTSRATSPTAAYFNPDRPPELPQIPPLPLSPRWDSLSNGAHVLSNPTSPKASSPSHNAWQQQPHHQPHQPLTQYATPLPIRDISRIIMSESQHDYPPTPKSPHADIRFHDHAVENFSRPRKSSIRHPSADPKLRLAYLPPSVLTPEATNGLPLTPASWHRSRGPSISSSKSSHTFAASLSFPPAASPLFPPAASPLFPPAASPSFPPAASPSFPPAASPSFPPAASPSFPPVLSPRFPPAASPSFPPANDLFESRSPRVRNAASPPVTVGRPPFGNSRVDSSVSLPMTGGAAPWMGGDELRSSFRSQLTSSTAPGTALTERSSVLTKDSSVTSLYANADEPSLEDVMGMYERGFCDDDDDDEYIQDDQENIAAEDKSEVATNLDLRPSTAMSEPAQRRGSPDDFDSNIEPVPPLPAAQSEARSAAQSALDAEIRQSKMLFASLAFTSNVPALSGSSRILNFVERRESARTVESEPSVESDAANTANAARNDARPNPTVVAPPSITDSRSPSPSVAQLPVPEPEEPGSRDRYGFKKESQHVTRQQYDAWDKGYSQYLARRRRKWTAYLKDNALMTDRPIRFPSPNAKTKRFVRKGIPPDWRGAAWFYYAGGPAILAKHGGLYDKLLVQRAKQVDIEAIERDLHRTFPDNIKFKPSASTVDILGTTTSSERASQSTMTGSSDGSSAGPMGLEGEPPIIASLRRVLLAFSVYNPRIGYCQSLNFIAGLLLLFVETEEQCFWLLNVITHIYLPGTHEMSLEGSKVDLGVLMTELRDTMPSVWDKIGGELESEPVVRPTTSKSVRKSPRAPLLKRKDTTALSTERLPPITLCMTAWFMSCYIGTLPIETTLRVWDVFFYEGSKTLFRVALAIFKLGESEIKAVSDPMEMFGVVQSMPRRMLDANQLMDACFRRRNGFNHLSQDVIEERRQERRDKTRLDMQRHRGKTVTGGNAREGEVERRGTLFGRRK